MVIVTCAKMRAAVVDACERAYCYLCQHACSLSCVKTPSTQTNANKKKAPGGGVSN